MKKLFHKGVTMIELVVSLALMGLVTTAAVSVLTLGVHGFNATKQVIDVTMADTDFATRISTAIRNSGTSFTIPQNSFKQANFTQGWNYLGLMSHVFIDKTISRTGEEIPDADALVYVEWYKPTEDDPVPDETKLANNQSVYHSREDGDFIITILGHSYVDRAGIARNYTLTFEPTDPDNHAAQSVKYTFGTLGDSDSTIQTVLESINAIQTVYQGSKTNPATAIAFRTDFNSSSYSSSYTAERNVYGTVVLVMDCSGSMNTYKLAQPMRDTAKQFLDDIALKNGHMNALLVPFAQYADHTNTAISYYNFKNYTPILDVVNIRQNLGTHMTKNKYDEGLKGTIDQMIISGNTNLGDGLRVAYWKLHNYETTLRTTITRTPDTTGNSIANPIHLVILSDGEMNRYLYQNGKSTTTFYTGDGNVPGGTASTAVLGSGAANSRKYISASNGIGKKIEDEFHPTVYVVNLNRGMADADLNAIKAQFPDVQTFEAGNFEEMASVFSEIGNRINGQMWAYEGPRLG
ncbi:MAG: prepilin-type N-terminal cleavage/methylation domain-containing protein [Lachnospiraceae bacterium]|nr:prepilin-type N-terminal cleavage/methylation domain-containing protein [Lachnospiraceae bacterium]